MSDYLTSESVFVSAKNLGSLLDFIVLDECKSTNDEAAKMIANRPLPFVVVAKKQTSGRGRMNRSWFSSEGASICFSIACDVSKCSADVLASATVRVGIAVCAKLNEICNVPLFLKWPNDIYDSKGRKIGGMLAELKQTSQGYVIVFGIGLNYDFSDVIEQIPQEFSANVADLRSRLCDSFNSSDVLVACSESAVKELVRVHMHSLTGFSKVDWLKGRRVDVSIGNRNFSGIADGINECGNLRVLLSDGSVEFVNSGEATLHK